MRWAPCPQGSTLEDGTCVTDVVRTVVLPAPSPTARAVATPQEVATTRPDDDYDHESDDHGDDQGDDQGDDHESDDGDDHGDDDESDGGDDGGDDGED